MIDKAAIILKLEENLHTTGPNIGKPNFSLVEKFYPEYTRKMLRDWYSKKDEILKSHHKHKRFKLDNPKANGEYSEMEEELDKYITELRVRGVCVSSFGRRERFLSGDFKQRKRTNNWSKKSQKRPKKAKKRANREAQYQRILSSSNPNKRPTYEIPATANNAMSASNKPDKRRWVWYLPWKIYKTRSY